MHKPARTMSLLSFLAPLLFAGFVCGAAAEPPSPRALQMSVNGQSITISNLNGSGKVVLFSCSRKSIYRSIRVRPEAIVLRDDDGDGVIRYAPADGITSRSVWIAVDENTGESVIAAGPEFPLIVRAFGSSLKKDAEGELASLAADTPRLVVLLVRPGGGAWTETVFDGDAHDHDEGHGRLQLAFEDSQTVDGKDKAPKHLKNNDVVVAIDPGHLDVFTAQVGK